MFFIFNSWLFFFKQISLNSAILFVLFSCYLFTRQLCDHFCFLMFFQFYILLLSFSGNVREVQFLVESYTHSISLLNVSVPNYSIIVIYFRNYCDSSLK